MFETGKKFFTFSNLMLLVVAGMHTLGVFREPTGTDEIRVMDIMNSYFFEAMGMKWSTHDVLVSLAFTMAIFLVFLAVLNGSLLSMISTRRVLERLGLLNAVLMWILSLLYLSYQIPPPFLSFVLLAILFTITYVRIVRRQDGALPDE